MLDETPYTRYRGLSVLEFGKTYKSKLGSTVDN